jgi:hypothetical protein
MSYLVRAIIEGIDKKYSKKMTGPRMARLIDKEISVEVEGIELKLKIDEPCIMNIIAKKQQGPKFDGNWVSEEDATEWIEKYLCGKIDKAQLDDQRLKESLGLDMIQNTNFVYHPESLLETQVISLILVFFYTNGMIAHYDKSVDNRDNIVKELKDH